MRPIASGASRALPVLAHLRTLLGRRRATPYDPPTYWEGRAQELIAVYDDPASWAERGWARGGVEEITVPELLARHDAHSAFVVGAGSGRQYRFLDPLGIALRGIDISPTLAAECRRRYPKIETTCESLIGLQERHLPADAVLSSAVLQHVPPTDFPEATRAVRAMARKLIVVRELTWMPRPSSYAWAHDYRTAFAGWRLVYDTQTDRTPAYEVRLQAWANPAP